MLPVDRESLSDLDLHAYVDNQLAPEERSALAERLAAHPEARDRAEDYAAHKRMLKLVAEGLQGEVANLQTAKLERELARRLAARRVVAAFSARARQAVAAAILLGLGWFGHVQYARLADPLPAYVAEAIGAHRVFAEDRVRPVELPATAGSVATSWLAAKLGVPITVPSFDACGVHFVGARLLGTKEGPLAQLIYEDHAGRRMSLTVAPHRNATPSREPILADIGREKAGYWHDGFLNYVLVATTSETQIRTLAAEVSKTAALY